MKLLLLDRPKDTGIISRRQVEFFGPWAQPLKYPEHLSRPAFEPYPLPESLETASLRAITVSNDLLGRLSKIMNDLTGISQGLRFWRILLGYYIITLVNIVEDIKIRQLSLPEKEYILGLPKKNYDMRFIPRLWSGVYENIFNGDYFIWHIMEQYLKDYYKNYEIIDYQRFSKRRIDNIFSVRLTQRAFKEISQFRSKKNILQELNSIFFDLYNIEDVDFIKKGAMALDDFKLPPVNLPFRLQFDRSKRDIIKKSVPAPYGELISLSLPLVALEALSSIKDTLDNGVLKKFNSIKRIYMHDQAHLEEWPKKTLLALLADKGKTVISVQHGCGSLLYFSNSAAFLNRVLTDEHIAWGLGYFECKIGNINKIRKLPSIYLSKVKFKKWKKNRWDVIFVVLEENRFVKWLYSPLFPDMAYDYFMREKRLFDYFGRKSNIAVKVYPEDYGWGQAIWIKKKYPGIRLLVSGRFIDYAVQSELSIVDYNSTAFLEMLVMNRPFLATWSRKWFRGNKIFEEYISRLSDAGVFYENPDELIKFYDTLSPADIKKWWLEEKRQNLLSQMAYEFALTSDNISGEWKHELSG